MKLLKICVSLLIILYSNYSFSVNQIKIYKCKLDLSTNIKNISPLEMSAPKTIKVSYDKKNNYLIDYIWDDVSVLKDFELIKEKIDSEFIEIRRKGFKKTLSNKNFRNGIFFKLYLNKRSANLNKQFIRPILYHC